MSVAQIGYDTTFELDDFGRPRLRSPGELLKNVLLTVLFYKPGQYPSIPTLGLNIGQMLLTFFDEIKEEELKDLIVSQCGALGVFFNSGQILIRKIRYRGKPSLMIHVETASDDLFQKDRVDSNLAPEDSPRFLIGITFDELNEMIYNISDGGGVAA